MKKLAITTTELEWLDETLKLFAQGVDKSANDPFLGVQLKDKTSLRATNLNSYLGNMNSFEQAVLDANSGGADFVNMTQPRFVKDRFLFWTRYDYRRHVNDSLNAGTHVALPDSLDYSVLAGIVPPSGFQATDRTFTSPVM